MNDKNQEYLNRVFSFWLGKKINNTEKYIGGNAPKYLNLLNGGKSGFFYRFTYRLIASTVLFLPLGYRYGFTSFLKSIRTNFKRKPVDEFVFVKATEKIRKELHVNKRKWNNRKFVICITHDVDYPKCYTAIRKIISLEQKYGIKSSWNFLTDNTYPLDKALLADLLTGGFEIGLHGYHHDIAFGFRSRKKMENQITKAMKKLPQKPFGFRAPGMSHSKELIEVLDSTNFKYDSSVPDSNRAGRGVEVCYPYIYPNTRIWELPMTTPQDSELFREEGLSDQEAFIVFKEKVQAIKQVNGVAVLLFHPCIIMNHLDFYENMLKFIKKQKQAWVVTPNEFVDYLNKKNTGL